MVCSTAVSGAGRVFSPQVSMFGTTDPAWADVDLQRATTSWGSRRSLDTPDGGGGAVSTPGTTERRQLTVMFTDLVGSTELASALDPEDWHDVLNAYQHRVAAIVTGHGGVIAQFQGDGAVAYFGYPEALESASRDALSAGIAIVDDITRLGSELAPDLGISGLQARVGIHTGEVLVAAVTAGGRERLPDVWGQVPNMAARLQAAGESGQIVVSGDTAELVAGFFELEPLGSLTLKGIGHPVPAYRVLQRSNARNRLEARPLTTFVPRTEASVWLEQNWGHVQNGSGRLALVLGEPGIGKSRLLLEFSSDLAGQGHTVTTIFCSRRGSLSPLQPFGEVMSEVPATPQEAVAWVEDRARRRSGPARRRGRALGGPQHAGSGARHRSGQRTRSGADERSPRDRRRSARTAGRPADTRQAQQR